MLNIKVEDIQKHLELFDSKRNLWTVNLSEVEKLRSLCEKAQKHGNPFLTEEEEDKYLKILFAEMPRYENRVKNLYKCLRKNIVYAQVYPNQKDSKCVKSGLKDVLSIMTWLDPCLRSTQSLKSLLKNIRHIEEISRRSWKISFSSQDEFDLFCRCPFYPEYIQYSNTFRKHLSCLRNRLSLENSKKRSLSLDDFTELQEKIEPLAEKLTDQCKPRLTSKDWDDLDEYYCLVAKRALEHLHVGQEGIDYDIHNLEAAATALDKIQGEKVYKDPVIRNIFIEYYASKQTVGPLDDNDIATLREIKDSLPQDTSNEGLIFDKQTVDTLLLGKGRFRCFDVVQYVHGGVGLFKPLQAQQIEPVENHEAQVTLTKL